jgi:hypothetical protein
MIQHRFRKFMKKKAIRETRGSDVALADRMVDIPTPYAWLLYGITELFAAIAKFICHWIPLVSQCCAYWPWAFGGQSDWAPSWLLVEVCGKVAVSIKQNEYHIVTT